jgi:hypothetical protein
MDFGFEGVGDRQPFQNIIITTLNHEHFPHGTGTFDKNSITNRMMTCGTFLKKVIIQLLKFLDYVLENN